MQRRRIPSTATGNHGGGVDLSQARPELDTTKEEEDEHKGMNFSIHVSSCL